MQQNYYFLTNTKFRVGYFLNNAILVHDHYRNEFVQIVMCSCIYHIKRKRRVNYCTFSQQSHTHHEKSITAVTGNCFIISFSILSDI